jgi:hypothetical protein
MIQPWSTQILKRRSEEADIVHNTFFISNTKYVFGGFLETTHRHDNSLEYSKLTM